jgi:subtilisin family serine protease
MINSSIVGAFKMDIRVKFADTASRDAFAKRFNLSAKVGDDSLDLSWHLLNFLKNDPNVTFENLAAKNSATPPEHDFIVSGDQAAISAVATIKQDLGKGFFSVTTNDGLALAKVANTIESQTSPLNYMDVSNITGIKPGTATNMLDPTSAEGQWPRIRIASRYRPLLAQFSTHEITYQSVPELIVMDSGINFNHEEFNYPELQTEDFYTLPQLNGNFRDDIGHGTAVASMAVGKNLGVASNCKLVNVKMGGMINGENYHANLLDLSLIMDALIDRINANPNVTRVINMSWGIARSAWLDSKVQALMDAGATVIAAAGNFGLDVADFTPMGIADVITVASIDKYDIPSGFNNIAPSDVGITSDLGEELDLFAPGENIMVADYSNTQNYMIMSGTSLAAPLVTGIAAEIASTFATMVPYTQLKKIILDTSTKHALLFEDDRFSENQNNLAYLVTSDPNSTYKSNSMTSYLGVHEDNQPIILDLHSCLDTTSIEQIWDKSINFSIEFLDPQIEKDYSKFFSVNNTTGIVTISEPTVVLPSNDKLKMIEFKGVVTNSVIKMESNILFFFQTNSMYKDTMESDITLALTNTNSISFYSAFTGVLK